VEDYPQKKLLQGKPFLLSMNLSMLADEWRNVGQSVGGDLITFRFLWIGVTD